MIFAGIGNRDLPERAHRALYALAQVYAGEGYILRSGGADGADRAFQDGYENFMGSVTEVYRPLPVNEPVPVWQWELVERFHPKPKALKPHPYRLMARNCQIILGPEGQTPVDFVACWARSENSGGSAFGIRLARWAGIPVINLCPTPEPDKQKPVKSMAYKLKKLGTSDER